MPGNALMPLRVSRQLWQGKGFPVPNASLGRASHPIPQMNPPIHQEPHGVSCILLGSPGPPGQQKGASPQAALLMPAEPVLQEVEEHFMHVSMKSLRCRGCVRSEWSWCHKHRVPLSLLLAPRSPSLCPDS